MVLAFFFLNLYVRRLHRKRRKFYHLIYFLKYFLTFRKYYGFSCKGVKNVRYSTIQDVFSFFLINQMIVLNTQNKSLSVNF